MLITSSGTGDSPVTHTHTHKGNTPTKVSGFRGCSGGSVAALGEEGCLWERGQEGHEPSKPPSPRALWREMGPASMEPSRRLWFLRLRVRMKGWAWGPRQDPKMTGTSEFLGAQQTGVTQLAKKETEPRHKDMEVECGTPEGKRQERTNTRRGHTRG